MRTHFSIFTAVLALGFETSSYAYSTVRRLSQTNIQDYASLMVVKVEHARNSSRRFRVIVTMPDQSTGARTAGFTGYLEVYRDKQLVAESAVASWPAEPSSNEVTPTKGKRFVFEFLVSSPHLEFSKFSITQEYGPEISAFDRYWIYLKDFADVK